MRLLVVLTVAALMSLSDASSLAAQSIRKPGELGASFQLGPNTLVDRYSTSEMPKTTVAAVDDSHDRFVNRVWVASMLAAVAGTSLDAVSSWGQRETNGLLASADGRFGAKGLSIKAGFAAATIIPQICLRKHKDLKTAFAVGNFGEAAIFGAISVHNFQVRNTASH